MANGKWITDLQASTPLADAVRHVLSVRLEVVHDHLPLALHKWKDDPEYVHQLRVGTRRAGAALAIFSLCLPGKIHKKIRKSLRELRRAAGTARDWDVFSIALAEREQQVTAAQRPGLDFLIGYSQSQRVAAQETLEVVGDGEPFHFERLAADTVAAVREPEDQRVPCQLRDLASPWLAGNFAELHAAATEKIEHYEQLHRIRILGKRLRYGMEVFAACFNAEFKDCYYPKVEEMQEILGQANDSHVAEQRLMALREILRGQPALWKRMRAGIDGVLKYHQRRLPQGQRQFVKWWAAWQKSGADAALTGMLEAKA